MTHLQNWIIGLLITYGNLIKSDIITMENRMMDVDNDRDQGSLYLYITAKFLNCFFMVLKYRKIYYILHGIVLK